MFLSIYINFQLPFISTVRSVNASQPYSLLLIKLSTLVVIGEFDIMVHISTMSCMYLHSP